MPGLNDVTISKGQGGLGRIRPSEDYIRGLVMNMGAVAPTGLAVATSKLLLQTKDAEDLGIDEAYDTAQGVLCHHHISEFFRANPSGRLWIRLVAASVTMTQMVDESGATVCPARQLMLDAEGSLRGIGINRNPASGYTPTITTGVDADVLTAIPKAQQLADNLFNEHMPCDFIVEGRGFSGSATALVDLRTMECANVSVVLAQDLDVVQKAGNLQPGYAAVGTLLGTSSAAKVSENVGWAHQFNLMSRADGRYLRPGISGLAITALTTAQYGLLVDKAAIFLRRFVGDSGVYFVDSFTCVEATSDYATMENNATINKAVREVYRALQPRVNSPVKVNAEGKMAPEVIGSYESAAGAGLAQMQRDEEVSAYDVYIDPDQDINTDSELAVQIKIIPIGCARFITVSIGFAQRIGA